LFPKIPRPALPQTAPYTPIRSVVKIVLCIDVSQEVSHALYRRRGFFTVNDNEKYFSGKGKQDCMSKIKTAQNAAWKPVYEAFPQFVHK
jgi:hypothetical protein